MLNADDNVDPSSKAIYNNENININIIITTIIFLKVNNSLYMLYSLTSASSLFFLFQMSGSK